MAIPLLPSPPDARFDADGFSCEIRSTDVLLSPTAMSVLSIVVVVAVGAPMGAVLTVAALGPLLATDLVGWMLLCCLATAWLVGGRALLDALLAAPRRTRLRCTHDELEIEVRVLGVRRRHERLPLGTVERCRVVPDGLEIEARRGIRRQHLFVEAPHLGADAARIAEEIERAAARRRRFERDQGSADRESARAVLELLLDQSDSGKRKRVTAGR